MDSSGATSKLLFTATEVAEKLGIGRSTVYELLTEGRLESVFIGSNRRVPAEALEVFVAALRVSVAEEATGSAVAPSNKVSLVSGRTSSRSAPTIP